METTAKSEIEPLEFAADEIRQTGESAWANDQGRGGLLPLLRQTSRNLMNVIGGGHIVEVGSWAGLNAMRMADDGFTVYCVDTWRGTRGDMTGTMAEALGPKAIFQTFCRNVGDRLHRTITPCVGRSRTWAEIWPFQVAAVFIDADHNFDACLHDMCLWWKNVLPGGLLIGHDVKMFPGVARAFQEWKDLHPELEHGIDGELWYTFKPSDK